VEEDTYRRGGDGISGLLLGVLFAALSEATVTRVASAIPSSSSPPTTSVEVESEAPGVNVTACSVPPA
jgi:hypothetical protein